MVPKAMSLLLQITAPNLVQSNGQIGSIPTGVQFSLSGQTGSSSINYDSVSSRAHCSIHYFLLVVSLDSV